VANTNPINFRLVRQLLAVKTIKLADAAGLNRSRLFVLESGQRDPSMGEDLTLRALLLKVALRRRLELEAAIMWLQSREPQTWATDPRQGLFEPSPEEQMSREPSSP
jgi:DNA-binding XRE family transcriptional regulator